MTRIFGNCETLLSTDTLQFESYSKTRLSTSADVWLVLRRDNGRMKRELGTGGWRASSAQMPPAA